MLSVLCATTLACTNNGKTDHSGSGSARTSPDSLPDQPAAKPTPKPKPDPEPEPKPKARGLELLERSAVRGEELYEQICGEAPPNEAPWDATARRMLPFIFCQGDITEIADEDLPATELLTVCVLALVDGDNPLRAPPSLDALHECMPESGHAHAQKWLETLAGYEQVTDSDIRVMAESLERQARKLD